MIDDRSPTSRDYPEADPEPPDLGEIDYAAELAEQKDRAWARAQLDAETSVPTDREGNEI